MRNKSPSIHIFGFHRRLTYHISLGPVGATLHHDITSLDTCHLRRLPSRYSTLRAHKTTRNRVRAKTQLHSDLGIGLHLRISRPSFSGQSMEGCLSSSLTIINTYHRVASAELPY
ncbi:uncharacterized protein An18g02540 [Aspergillus niger]|uniref:Contig An18c0070, genomic contig n=2 Tax=Aspergillus niger TaxID=5061 RepID=A2RAB1_ASPNC|nr:uncharacterized protein An18g02540 [Aspergillus niger]CAK43183.1 unnamed protein product [Aspergillus niger]